MIRGFICVGTFILLFCFMPQTALSQFSGGKLGINGLTCSQCSRSVEMALRQLKFLENITMNLERTECTFTVKESHDFSVFAIRDAVRQAGFSLRFLNLQLTEAPPDSPPCFRSNNVVYHLTDDAGTFNLSRPYQVLAAGFVPARELKNMVLNDSGACKGRQTVFLRPAARG